MYSKIVVISLVLVTLSVGKTVESAFSGEICPKLCTCDIIDGLKRADCSHENLINTYTDVPIGVEILDLSINKISAVENGDFEDYTDLVKLFLSENSIQTIALYAFSTLRSLEQLDLSHNRLEQLNENLFEYNEKLVDLNLSNNNFISLQNRPFLISSSIMNLHLSECKIPQLYERLFVHLANLRTLDLSGNLMITLPKEPFTQLRKLRVVDLHENWWQCDGDSVRTTVTWMRKRIASVQIEQCFKTPYKSKAMFEKMELDPHHSKSNREDIAIDQVWGTASTTENYWTSLKAKTCAYNDDSQHNSPQDPEARKTCEDFIECQKKFSELYHMYTAEIENRKNKPAHFNDRLAATLLLCGLFIGLIFGSFMTYSLMCLAQRCRESRGPTSRPPTLRELRREFRERNNFEHSRLTESPPPLHPARQPITNLSRQQQSQIYSNHENTRQFLVDLFSKRQPRLIRNNSQLSNIQNRYMPPTPARDQPSSPVAPTSSSFIWESPAVDRENESNQERERMLAPGSHQSLNLCLWNSYYGVEEFRQQEQEHPTVVDSTTALYEVVPIGTSPLQRSVSVRRESPPPPYVDCAEDCATRSEP